jgi:hypothetical protein
VNISEVQNTLRDQVETLLKGEATLDKKKDLQVGNNLEYLPEIMTESQT